MVVKVINERALAVMERVENKLNGRDFVSHTTRGSVNVEEQVRGSWIAESVMRVALQVQQLIDSAMSHENLCQCYTGWCPFW